MNNKKICQEERRLELERRKELENMIKGSSSTLESATRDAMTMLPNSASLSLNYEEVKSIIDRDSKDIVSSIALFYLDKDNIVDKDIENGYLKQKIKVDVITVSSLLFQMKTAEHAIIKLLAEIDSGNFQPRTFEVLAALQRSKMEIVKHLAQFMIIMENAYKNFNEDSRVKKIQQKEDLIDVDSEEIAENGGIRTKGTKDLLRVLDKLNKEREISENEKLSNINNYISENTEEL